MKKCIVNVFILGLILITIGCGNTNSTQKASTSQMATVTETTEVLKEIEYYEECEFIPKVESCTDAKYLSKMGVVSPNPSLTVYKYKKDDVVKSTYLEILRKEGLIVEASTEQDMEYDIAYEGMVVGRISEENGELYIYIIPESERTMLDSSAEFLSLGQILSTDDYIFKLNNVEFIYELNPSNTSGTYTTYQAEAGNVYIHIDADFTNKSKKDVYIGDLPQAKADYDNGYKYIGTQIIDAGDDNFDWVDFKLAAEPLATCHYHGLIECPEIVESSDASVVITLVMNDGKLYKYNLR